MYHYPFQSMSPPQLPLALGAQTRCHARILPRTDHSLSLLPLQFLLACLPLLLFCVLVQAHHLAGPGALATCRTHPFNQIYRPHVPGQLGIPEMRVTRSLRSLFDKQMTRNKQNKCVLIKYCINSPISNNNIAKPGILLCIRCCDRCLKGCLSLQHWKNVPDHTFLPTGH